ncbi:MAG TPA: hypothetical protein VFD78_02905 [Chitinophagaceae bacterium]|nr:hypothetical protein [Chitinophagaceae bacterium]
MTINIKMQLKDKNNLIGIWENTLRKTIDGALKKKYLFEECSDSGIQVYFF